MPSPFVAWGMVASVVTQSGGLSVSMKVTLSQKTAPPPRKPRPLTSIAWPFQLRLPATSSTTTPPVLPFQYGALTVPPRVSDECCGTRMTWKVRRPALLAGSCT